MPRGDAVAGGRRDPAAVRAMFDRIAGRYDLANTVMTLGQDQRWRMRTARRAIEGMPAPSALDCACGTGRLAAALYRAGALRVTGADFSERMLAAARQRHPEIAFVRADVAALPFDDSVFDAATIGFGLRNLAEPGDGLREMVRVVRPGGRVAVLEAVRPSSRVGELLSQAGPRLSGLLSRDRAAYRYLSETVRGFASAGELADWLVQAGLTGVRTELLALGTVALVWGARPGDLLE